MSASLESLAPATQEQLKKFFQQGLQHGCPRDQLLNFSRAGIILQPTQLTASAAARLCDHADGPKAIGYGGARGGGKTHWLLAQMGADDCQRVPGLKCLLLRKVGKSNLENFEGLRQRIFPLLPHEFNTSRAILAFANGSRIFLGHFQSEKDIDSYLGLEYDVIGIEEATQLTLRKYEDISTCCRTSKILADGHHWRPRIYSTTNPGGIGHHWYLEKFITPHECRTESATRFIPARVDDNAFINPEYKSNLASRTGWQYDAWYLGRWNFSAGQYFRNFHPAVHIIGTEPEPNGPAAPFSPQRGEGLGMRGDAAQDCDTVHAYSGTGALACRDHDRIHAQDGPNAAFLDDLARLRRFRESDAVEWVAAMDYGYTHRTAVLLGCRDHAGNLFVVDEHAERHWIPQRHAQAVKAMFARHGIYANQDHLREWLLAQYPDHCTQREQLWHRRQSRMLTWFFAGADMFGRESGGDSVAKQYQDLGLRLRPANMDRVSGWSAILQHLGDPEVRVLPRLFIHRRCQRLIESLPYLQHDPDRPGDVLKTNINEEGVGGDDAADALRYLVASKVPWGGMRKLTGF